MFSKRSGSVTRSFIFVSLSEYDKILLESLELNFIPGLHYLHFEKNVQNQWLRFLINHCSGMSRCRTVLIASFSTIHYFSLHQITKRRCIRPITTSQHAKQFWENVMIFFTWIKF